MIEEKEDLLEPKDDKTALSVSNLLQSGTFGQSNLLPVSTPSVQPQPIPFSYDVGNITPPNNKDTDMMNNEEYNEQRLKIIAERYSKWKQSRKNKIPATSTTNGNIDRNSNTPIVKPIGKINRVKAVKNNSILSKCFNRIVHVNLQGFRKRPVIATSLGGKLKIMITLSFVFFVVFLGQLIFNKITFNGRCLAPILYSKLFQGLPIYSPIGYSACEINLNEKAEKQVFFGLEAADEGYPREHVFLGETSASPANMDSPNDRIYEQYGAVESNKVRHYNEKFRLFWAMFMHDGWFHLLFNTFSFVQILWIIEPDWGFWRTLFLFFFPAYIGNIFVAVYSPGAIILGASGGVFSCLGALVPYTVEMWNDLVCPVIMFFFALCTIIIGSYDAQKPSHYVHISSCLFGLLFGFATIRDVSSLYKGYIFRCIALCRPFVWCIPKKSQTKLRESVERISKIIRKGVNNDVLIKERKIATTPATHAVSSNKKHKRRGKREYICCVISGTILLIICIYLHFAIFYAPLYETINGDSSIFFNSEYKCCKIKEGDTLIQQQMVQNVKGLYWCFFGQEIASYYCPT